MRNAFCGAMRGAAACACMLYSLSFGRSYTYDDLNHVTRILYDDGASVSYAYDEAGNIIEVKSIGPDTTRPVIASPDTVQAFCLPGDTAAKVYFTVKATDVIDGILPVATNPESGSKFQIGRTTVKCSVTNSRNINSIDSFVVIVNISTIGAGGAIAVAVMTKGVRIAVKTGVSGSNAEKLALRQSQLAKLASQTWESKNHVASGKAISDKTYLINGVSLNSSTDSSQKSITSPHLNGAVAKTATTAITPGGVNNLQSDFSSILDARNDLHAPMQSNSGSSFSGILVAPASGFYKITLQGTAGAKLWLSDSDKPLGRHIILETTENSFQTFIGLELKKGEQRYIRADAPNDPVGFSASLTGPGIVPAKMPGKYVTPIKLK